MLNHMHDSETSQSRQNGKQVAKMLSPHTGSSLASD